MISPGISVFQQNSYACGLDSAVKAGNLKSQSRAAAFWMN
jgi:hypothetical protein